jgi:hypothetical protein
VDAVGAGDAIRVLLGQAQLLKLIIELDCKGKGEREMGRHTERWRGVR